MFDTAAPEAPTAARSQSWRARLDLRYERRGDRSVLAASSHEGPLVVQKSLYDEGDPVCHNIVVHPPGGIAGGDRLHVDVSLGHAAHAKLTTPGAAKWYRSAGEFAQQRTVLHVSRGAALEWLPQEAIFFDGAKADLDCVIDLDDDAVFIGWEIVCLGRGASGERFARGVVKQRVALFRDSARVFAERAILEGGSRLLDSAAGLKGARVFGTFFAAAPLIADALLSECRDVKTDEGDTGVTRLPGLLLARCLGGSAEAARAYFVRIWSCARRVLLRREAVAPRIWNT